MRYPARPSPLTDRGSRQILIADARSRAVRKPAPGLSRSHKVSALVLRPGASRPCVNWFYAQRKLEASSRWLAVVGAGRRNWTILVIRSRSSSPWRIIDFRASTRPRARLSVTLDLVDFVFAQQLQLFVVLDTLGDDLHAHGMRHRHQRLDDFLVAFVAADIADEAAIDLEAVDRQRLEVAQRRITGTEIVDRDVQTARMQTLQRLDRMATCFPSGWFR